LTDLLVKLRFERIIICGVTLSLVREDFGQTFNRLFLPLQDLIRMNAIVRGNLIDCSLTFDCLDRDFHFEYDGICFSLLSSFFSS